MSKAESLPRLLLGPNHVHSWQEIQISSSLPPDTLETAEGHCFPLSEKLLTTRLEGNKLDASPSEMIEKLRMHQGTPMRPPGIIIMPGLGT